MTRLEKEDGVSYSRARAALNAWLGWLMVDVKLEEEYTYQFCLLRTDDCFLMIGQICTLLICPNDMWHTRRINPSFVHSVREPQRCSHYWCFLECRTVSTTLERTRSWKRFGDGSNRDSSKHGSCGTFPPSTP